MPKKSYYKANSLETWPVYNSVKWLVSRPKIPHGSNNMLPMPKPSKCELNGERGADIQTDRQTDCKFTSSGNLHPRSKNVFLFLTNAMSIKPTPHKN